MRPLPRHAQRRIESMRFTAQLYIWGGVLLMLDVFLSPYLEQMFESNPVRGCVLLAGETCVLVGFTVLCAYHKRLRRIRPCHSNAMCQWRG